jgi:hypothetical protein
MRLLPSFLGKARIQQLFSFYVIKVNGNYALVRVLNVHMGDYLTGLTVRISVQTNGSLDFSEVLSTRNPRMVGTRVSLKPGKDHYNLMGKKIDAKRSIYRATESSRRIAGKRTLDN